jgi:orotate phosphoribosyltransferase
MKHDTVSTLLDLIKTKCYEYRNPPFKLSSGKFSNNYFDCRNLLSSSEGFYYVGSVMADILIKQILNNNTYPIDMNDYIPKCRMTPYETCYRSIKIQAVGGMAVGSISVSNAIMANLLYKHNIDINSFYVRKVSKEHGKTGRIVGVVNQGDKIDRIVIVDDVLTTGHSISNAIESLQEERNARVIAVLALIDREEGGKENIINKFNIPVLSVFTKTDILFAADDILNKKE